MDLIISGVNMISFKKLRELFFKTSLVVLLTMISIFSFASANSWALEISLVNKPSTYLAVNQVEKFTNDIKDKAQDATDNISEAFDKIKGEPKDKNQIAKDSKEFKAKTLEGINNGIENPKYQPSGKTKQAKKESVESKKNMKAGASEAFK